MIEANAFRESEIIRGEGDATATGIYAEAYNQNPEFYSFMRSLRAYQETFQAGSDILVMDPDSEFFKYLRDPKAGN